MDSQDAEAAEAAEVVVASNPELMIAVVEAEVAEVPAQEEQEGMVEMAVDLPMQYFCSTMAVVALCKTVN